MPAPASSQYPTAIGAFVGGSSTVGSLLFVGTSNLLGQDNANLFWDTANARLGLGTASPAVKLHAKSSTSGLYSVRTEHSNVGGYSGIEFYDSTPTQKGAVGYGNSAVSQSYLQSKLFHYSTGPDWLFANATKAEFTFGMTDGSTFIEMADGVSAAVSSANTGRIRYNNTTHTFQTSLNGAAYSDIGGGGSMAIGGTVTSGTAGSVLFVGTGPVLSQDNADFFWDNTNKRLGIGTASPQDFMHVKGSGPGLNTFRAENTSTSGYSAYIMIDSSAAFVGGLYYGNSAVGNTSLQGKFGWVTQTKDIIFYDSGNSVTNHVFGMGSSATYHQFSDGISAPVSPANTGRIIYNNTTHTFQASVNGGGYADIGGAGGGMSIGGTVTSGTAGSILFVATGPVLAQNNADLNWDNTNFTLGVSGGNSSHFALDIHGLDTSGNQNTVRIANNAGGSGLPVLQFDRASANVGNIIGFDSASFGLANGLTVQVPSGKNFGVRIGSGLSTNQIVSIDPTNSYIFSNLSVGHQNNPATTIDARASVSGGGIMSIENTSSTGFSDILFYNESRVLKGAVGYANASETAVSSAAGLNILYTEGSPLADWAVINGTANKAVHLFGSTSGSVHHQMTDGASAAVSAANTGRLRYNDTAKLFQASVNGGAYVDMGSGLYCQVKSATPTQASTGLTNWWNQPASATVADNAVGVTVFDPNQSSTNNPALRYVAAPGSTPWSITALISFTGPPNTNTGAMFGMSNGTANSNKIEVILWNPLSPASTSGINRYDNFSTFNSSAYSAGSTMGFSPIWFKLRNDGTTFTYQLSTDGVNFATMLSVTISGSYLGTYSTIVFGPNGFAGLGYATLLSWTQGT